MIYLARYILRGPGQAALCIATLAMLGWIPLFGLMAILLSGAGVALVTLVQEPKHSAQVVLLALLASVGFSWLIFQTPVFGLYMALALWLPVGLVAASLRQTGSLSWSLGLISFIAILVLLAFYSLYPGYTEVIKPLLAEAIEQYQQQYAEHGVDPQRLALAQDVLVRYFPALVVSGMLFSSFISLLLGRWWQSVLYHAGGFATEFAELRLGRSPAIIAMGLSLVSLASSSDMMKAILLIVIMLYLVQGLAILFAALRSKGISAVWMYAVLFLLMVLPQLILLFVLFGLADAWVDFRKRHKA